MDSVFRNISDTARWVAVFRARESERPDPVFQDPFARRLAGERGEEIAGSIPFAEKNSWPFVARTWLIDQMIAREVKEGADMVVNLAAGLDARPYRMELPPSLQWFEVDFPEILAYKEDILREESPICQLQRVKLDLANQESRRELFQDLGKRSQRTLIVAEGLLVYLADAEVGSLLEDLAAEASFCHLITDLASPALLKMLRKRMAAPLEQAGLPLKFGPQEGPAFFHHYGWETSEIRTQIQAAAKIKRLPWFLRLMSRFFSSRFKASRPWSAVCLFARRAV